jgi:hypothetical protein
VARRPSKVEPRGERTALAAPWPACHGPRRPTPAGRRERRPATPAAPARPWTLCLRLACRVGPPNSLLTPLS